ncbi:hypothetical protein CXP39_03810 [Mesoplasma syrphidae]|uniref:Lipoprotein n=1 Tax=Mesoplasma syrphidae TaxID=225999 RepID=A0A2K9BVZ6_9MOLU|nr:hypothetical protein [Mesoplasma syrphidae]AUF83890.1 hypothetical protein CXP39_03810 [Mesoplasma syrphidae]
MKKILGLLMSMTIISAGTASVVACTSPVKSIPTYFANSENMLNETDFVKWDKDNNKYVKDEEAFKEWKAKKPVDQKTAINIGLNGRTGVFNRLRSDISNVLTYSGRETTKDKFLAHKKTFKGVDEGTSVDGIYDDVLTETKKPEEYYARFQNTQVSSLLGLYQLQKFVKSGDVTQETANKASGNNLQVVEQSEEFFKSIASEGDYASKNGSFTKIEYSFEAANADNKIAYVENGETIEKTELKVAEYLSPETNVYELSEDAANKAKGQTGNAGYDPFAQKTVSSDSVVKADIFQSAEFTKKEKTDDFRKEYLAVSSERLDDLKFEYVATKDKDNKYSLTVNNKLSYITAPTSIDVKYVYNTDIELKTGEEKGRSFTVEAKIEGIRAVYRPSVAGVKVQKDGKAKTQFGWVLVGYQFNGDKDSQVTENGQSLEAANKKTGTITYHNKFKDFKISNLQVSEGDKVK